MAAHGKKKKRHDDHGDHPDERWLVTYTDLMTLLVALFMVLFSISSVNKSKFETLQASLQDAFSGRILPGGKSIKEAGGTDNQVNPAPQPPESNLQPFVGGKPADGKKTGGKTDGDSLIGAAKGLKWDSPRGPMSIDPETRDVVQTIYIRKVEKKGGELWNTEFETIADVKDPVKAARK